MNRREPAHGEGNIVMNVGGFNAAKHSLKASGEFLTERLGSTAR